MITVDLSEQGSVISEMGYHSDLVKKYKIRAAPWLLITCQGSVLHNEKMGGFVHRLRWKKNIVQNIFFQVLFKISSRDNYYESRYDLFHLNCTLVS